MLIIMLSIVRSIPGWNKCWPADVNIMIKHNQTSLRPRLTFLHILLKATMKGLDRLCWSSSYLSSNVFSGQMMADLGIENSSLNPPNVPTVAMFIDFYHLILWYAPGKSKISGKWCWNAEESCFRGEEKWSRGANTVSRKKKKSE